jgi:manganese/zinc/iron transport system permease protein
MKDLLPPFSWYEVFLLPWQEELPVFGWIVLMGFFVTAACGLIGNYLILRRMALIGDAISHSVLPGIAIAFLVAQSRGSLPLFIGALVAGILTTILIELIHGKSRIKQDSAIGITFSCFFAFGVILISIYAGTIDLDADCVLFGEIGWVPEERPYVTWGGLVLGPLSVVRMGLVLLATMALIVLFYKELLITSFDPELATSLGIHARVMHYALMSVLSVIVVSAFEAVGAILVIAMLILPGATAALLSQHLLTRLLLTLLHAVGSSIGGIHIALALNASIAPAMVIAGSLLFILAWLVSPTEGLRRLLPHPKARKAPVAERI